MTAFDNYLMTYTGPDLNLKPEPYLLDCATRRHRFSWPMNLLRERAIEWSMVTGNKADISETAILDTVLDECMGLVDLSSACRIEMYYDRSTNRLNVHYLILDN